MLREASNMLIMVKPGTDVASRHGATCALDGELCPRNTCMRIGPPCHGCVKVQENVTCMPSRDLVNSRRGCPAVAPEAIEGFLSDMTFASKLGHTSAEVAHIVGIRADYPGQSWPQTGAGLTKNRPNPSHISTDSAKTVHNWPNPGRIWPATCQRARTRIK